MPKIADHGERRSSLVDSGLDLLAREGLEAATMRRLAVAANCTTGMITHYFENREALLLAMLRHVHTAAGARMIKAVARASTPRTKLDAVLLESLPLDAARLVEWKVWLAFWGAVPSAPNLAIEHAQRYDEWRSLLLRLVHESGLHGEGANRTVTNLIAIVDGYGLQMTLTGSPKSKVSALLQEHCRRALEQSLDAAGI